MPPVRGIPKRYGFDVWSEKLESLGYYPVSVTADTHLA